MAEFGVSLKEPRKSNNNSGVGLELDFGVKVHQKKQILEAFPYEETMMMMMMLSPSYHHHNHPSSVSTPSSSTAFKSSGGMMTASSLGFPFTNAQWKELQRQSMIYKYMMASLPVPPHLLIPIPASPSPLDSGSNVRFSSSNSNDAEPGRCRRTDGKKWRCSRDVAPNHKYCERHMHRGRPRSRKPVEVQLQPNNPIIINNNDINHQIKRPRHDYPPFSTTTSPAVPASIFIPTISTDFGSSSSTQFLASTVTTTHPQPHFGSPLSPHKLPLKSANLDSLASVSSNKEPRGLEWMLKRDPISMSMAAGSDPEWHHPLLQNRTGLKLNPGSCSNNSYMNPYELFSSGIEQQDNNNKQRGFIDAWSNAAETEESNPTEKSNDARLSLSSSLDLSMGSIGMGLGLMEAPASWMACSTPGGPLGEVLRPTSTNETGSNSNPSSPVVTMVTSPSGVLQIQKTLASLSDSSTSSSSSPRVASSTTRAYTKLQSSS